MKTRTTRWLEKIKISGTALMFQAFTPLAPIDTQSGKLSGLYTGGDLSSFIQKLFVFALTVGAIIAVVRLMFAGYLYMGSEMWGSKSKAREIFVNVIMGLLLLLSIWIILEKINPQILNLDILTSEKNAPATNLAAPTPQQNVAQPCGPGFTYRDPKTGGCI